MPERSDRPRVAVSTTSTRENRTGSWKYIRPQYRDAVAPCNHACPAGVDVEGYMNLLREGRLREAVDLLLRENPMPAVTGRVCHHPCEGACSRRTFDDAVAVHAVERAVGDFALERLILPRRDAPRAEAVAVLGGGPAGLSCAWHLARAGYPVTVYDEGDSPGGMLRQGIPAYRLPRDVLDRQIEAIAAMGVRFRTGVRLEGALAAAELDRYDAVFLATGAHHPRLMGVPGEDGPGVVPGLGFLKAVNRGDRPDIGRRVAVIGGGNTAMDCARTALRLGAAPVVVYRRTRAEMPAIPQEVEEAMREGVDFIFLAAPAAFHHRGGRLVAMDLMGMELGEPDASGRRRPVRVDDGGVTLEVDTVLAAIGEDPDIATLPPGLGTAHGGSVRIDPLGATGTGKLFAGGDLANEERSVAAALGSGKAGAIGIDRYLRWLRGEVGPRDGIEELRWAGAAFSASRWRGDDPVPRTDPRNEVVPAEDLRTVHFRKLPRHPEGWRSGPLEFTEVNTGLDLRAAVDEARRCFNCGVCNDCELCMILCPDVAISPAPGGHGFVIDLDHCKGCGICAEECPRGAIVMTREEL